MDKLQGVGGKGEYAYRGVAAISGDMVAIVRMRTGGVAGNVIVASYLRAPCAVLVHRRLYLSTRTR